MLRDHLLRTTVAVDDQLPATARRRARDRGLTISRRVETAPVHEIARASPARDRPAIAAYDGGSGPRPGIGLLSNRALIETLDEGGMVEPLRWSSST